MRGHDITLVPPQGGYIARRCPMRAPNDVLRPSPPRPVAPEVRLRRFAKRLDDNVNVRFFMKLPSWFTVDTPIGPYNPYWVIVFENTERVYLVRERKGSSDPEELRGREETKIRCATKHFDAVGVDTPSLPVSTTSSAA